MMITRVVAPPWVELTTLTYPCHLRPTATPPTTLLPSHSTHLSPSPYPLTLNSSPLYFPLFSPLISSVLSNLISISLTISYLFAITPLLYLLPSTIILSAFSLFIQSLYYFLLFSCSFPILFYEVLLYSIYLIFVFIYIYLIFFPLFLSPIYTLLLLFLILLIPIFLFYIFLIIDYYSLL
jgi:hypothetical protein